MTHTNRWMYPTYFISYVRPLWGGSSQRRKIGESAHLHRPMLSLKDLREIEIDADTSVFHSLGTYKRPWPYLEHKKHGFIRINLYFMLYVVVVGGGSSCCYCFFSLTLSLKTSTSVFFFFFFSPFSSNSFDNNKASVMKLATLLFSGSGFSAPRTTI